jgi:hypothetical protein
MAIAYTITSGGDTLYVKTHGCDDNVEEVVQYGMAIIQAAQASGCRHVLCDELELTYQLGTLDTFTAAKTISEYAPRVGRVAIVCKPQHFSDAEFWETVAVNRGLMVRVFPARAEAEAWLAH